MKFSVVLCSVLFLIGCPPKTDPDKTPPEQPSKEVPPKLEKADPPPDRITENYVKQKPVNPILLKQFSTSDIFTGANYKGVIISGLSWIDANGDNVVIFSRDPEKGDGGGTVWLYANHYARKDGVTKTLREVKQKASCDVEFDDLIARFKPESFEVSDLDGNGLGEATFAYKYTCTTDVSPMTYKLLIIENGDKYILRGNTTVKMDGDVLGGDYKTDESFSTKPEFLEHAKKVWRNTSVDTY